MRTKKSLKFDLERHRPVYLQIGFVIALSATLIAFEWSSTAPAPDLSFSGVEVDVFVEMVPVTTTHKEEMVTTAPPRPLAELVIGEIPHDLSEPLDLGDLKAGGELALNAGIYSPIPEVREPIYDYVEIMPSFPGGEQALIRFLSDHVRYPEDALNNNVSGRVYVSFVVNRHGEVVMVDILRGVHPSLDREAMRVVKMMPKWEPGIQNGVPVNVSYVIPVNFSIRGR